jgi:3-oxoacyl-[acyl-carrier protein] reductase
MTSAQTSRPRALVTGARRGIGRGIAWAFAENGYDVVINDIAEDALVAETLAGIRERGAEGGFVHADVADLGQHAALIERAFAAFGGLKVLVNNAGIQVAKRQDMLETTAESFDALMDVNLRGPFFLTQRIARRWLSEKTPAHARSIINIASVNSAMPAINRAEYCISKTGVSMMTELFAVRLAEAGIGVYEIRPGIIRTDMTAGVRDAYDKMIADGVAPMRRWGEPKDIGRAAVALVRGDFGFSTGTVVHVDGGLHIHRL